MVKNKDIWNKVVNEVVESNLPGMNVVPVVEVAVDNNWPVVEEAVTVVVVVVVTAEEGIKAEVTVMVVVVVEGKLVDKGFHKWCTFHKQFGLWKLLWLLTWLE